MKKRKTKSKRKFTKVCKAGITPQVWILLQELKVRTGMSKAAIIREALQEYSENHSK